MLLTLGSAHGSHDNMSVTMEQNVNLINGKNNISILSATVGLPVIVSFVKTSFRSIINKQRKPHKDNKYYILNKSPWYNVFCEF